MTTAGSRLEPKCVGVLGLGRVGLALATRLRALGHACLGFDIDPAAVQRFAQAGHAVAQTPAALAQAAEIVVCAVYDTAALAQAWSGAADAPGLCDGDRLRFVIDCSTGDPAQIETLAATMAARGVALVESPLSGSSTQIAAGTATALVAGEPAAIEHLHPWLDALAPRRHVVGRVGMGARAKLATNLVLGLNRAALAEGMVLAERLGLGRAAFLALVLDSPARSEAAVVKGALMVDERFEPAQSRIVQHLKDLDLMLAQAAQADQHLPLTEAHAALLRRAVAAGDGDLDNAGITRQIGRERRTGTPPTPPLVSP